MRHGTRWMLLLGAVCTAAMAGCSQQPYEPLAELPTHQLALPAPPPAPRKVKIRPSRPAPPVVNEWQAKGRRAWRHIVIHHSASDGGSAALFDKAHRHRGWDELGYHFVINNGRGGPDGRVEVGGRWRIQKWGAHCGGTPNNEYNNHGVGICLVGNFTRRLPSRAQVAALRRLVVYLMRTYDIPSYRVIGHQAAPNAATKCPGGAFQAYLNNTFRPQLRRELAMSRR